MQRSRSILLSAFLIASLAGLAPGQDVLVVERVELTPEGLQAGDAGPNFGSDVALSGDTLLVGAEFDGAAGVDAGGAFVFERANGAWTQTARLLAPAASPGDRFGASVAVAGDTLLVGAPRTDAPGEPDAGAAFLFARDANGWTLLQSLGASSPRADDYYGFDVALDGDRALVGSWGEDALGGAPNAGAAYVYVRVGTEWQLEARLESAQADPGGFFGYSVALDGRRALIGALAHDGFAPSTGAAFVFDRAGTSWSQSAQLAAVLQNTGELFGASVALRGDRALVGAPFDAGIGAAYLFELEGVGWLERQRLAPEAGFLLDQVGRAVELVGPLAAVGDLQGPNGRNSGAVRVFESSDTGFVPVLTLQASDAVDTPDGADAPFFSWSIAADAGTLAVAARRDDGVVLDAGSVYVFDFASARFCNGFDESLAACPCSAGTAAGGCDVAQATGGVELSLAAQLTGPTNRATLRGKGFPAAASPTAVVLRARSLEPDGPTTFGDGLRCIGLPVVRLGAAAAAGGVSVHPIGHGPGAGEGLAYYQLWFRNAPASFCDPASAFNLSSGRTLLW